MEQNIAKICPNCGGKNTNAAASFCSFCGGSLLGDAIVSNNRNIVETVNEIEDKNLRSWNGIERPETSKDLGKVIGCSAGILGGFIGFMICFLAFAFGIIVADFSVIACTILFGLGMAALIVSCVIAIIPPIKSLQKEQEFKNGKPETFIGEIRSYGTGNNGKNFNYVSVRDERDNVFIVKLKSSKRKFYIGEKVKVTVSNGIYNLDKTEKVE